VKGSQSLGCLSGSVSQEELPHGSNYTKQRVYILVWIPLKLKSEIYVSCVRSFKQFGESLKSLLIWLMIDSACYNQMLVTE
jgi:hypothetical protein